MIVADTDVLIDFLTDREPAAERVAALLGAGSLATTAVARFELQSGVRDEREERRVRDLLAALPVLPLDGAAADAAATVRRELRSRGEDVGMADSLIAGIALAAGAELFTRNRRHFSRVPSLRLAALD
ncbi:MAG TPA: PIN domain-containing protein [Thermoanaerobaculia bacterium]|nr:PIN domain-containing protein [Thermoanaerobaculia bacterium]